MRCAAIVLLFDLLLTGVQAAIEPQRAKATPDQRCDKLCADLITSIQKHPARLGMWLEDALVINESCAVEIITAAMDAVNNDPEYVRIIEATALHVAPQRASQIRAALRKFTIPAAQAWEEPAQEIRRAIVPLQPDSTGPLEVRRAIVPAAGKAAPEPPEEVRRALLPGIKAARQ